MQKLADNNKNQSSQPQMPVGLSPVMAQFWEVKQQYPDCLLFFRMGDFYELFFEDAILGAKDMDINLTHRGKQEGAEIPMCGVPVHTYETYLARLIQKGHKVAVCEQIEDPETAKKRGAKGPLRRDVVRVVTPGTLTEESLLDARQNNFLVALSPLAHNSSPNSDHHTLGVATIDLSTGSFLVEETTVPSLGATLARLNPAEIILPDRLLEEPSLYETFGAWKRKLSPLPQARFDQENGRRRLEAIYKVKTLDGFGSFSSSEIRAAGVLVDYIQITQKSALKLLDRPRQISANTIMTIDPSTRRSLELEVTLSGSRQGTLLSCIDRTVTAAGARLLSMRLAAPLTNSVTINQRLDMVTFFVEASPLRQKIRGSLKVCPDMERALSRINLGRGSPRDLAAIRDGLTQAEQVKQTLMDCVAPEGVKRDASNLGHHHPLIERLTRALGEDLPVFARDGGFIAVGYHEELDTFRILRDNSRDLVANLQSQYISQTGINSLKIKHNNVIGYHIDIGPSHASKIPTEFIHRQTLASSMRYTTVELAELERRIEAAARQTLELELQLFADLLTEVHTQAPEILTCCRALASLDVISSLAELAVTEGYNRPTVDDSLIFEIKGGQHPVVATVLRSSGDTPFVANDCCLNDQTKLLLLTGPNMAGKSTYLRQNALLTLMAQMGSYIPVTSAHIGVVDRLFSRVGAADDLAAGRSTFMVEMIETAAILHQATERSYVILDEIGRGTSTYDGVSIAWAVVEALCKQTRCRGLFATHYHELTCLSESLPTLACFTVRIKEWEGKVIFLHEVVPGCADKSYGIHVAALAGLPHSVLSRAEQILVTLEARETGRANFPLVPELPHEALAENASNVVPFHSQPKPTEVEQALSSLDVDSLSPREALDVLYRLKSL